MLAPTIRPAWWTRTARLGLALALTAGLAPAGGAEAPALPKLAVELAFPKLKFHRPVEMIPADDFSNLLFVVEQVGTIQSFPNDPQTSDQKPFLDIAARIYGPHNGGHNEEGLLGLAFHPKYDWLRNRDFFVHYSAHEGPSGRRSIVSRFRTSKETPRRADPDSEERIWIGPPDPDGSHNGGGIVFGPDGYLYISMGDGGPVDDPLTTGQNPKDVFGSILRIDVDHPASGKPYGIPKDNPRLRDPKFAHWAPEVYCIGLRNVWKFSFDRLTGTLWAGDVGQNKWEMVHIITNGGNYGWSFYESFHPFRVRQKLDPAARVSKPLVEYPHSPNLENSGRRDDGLSITGGYVYRGRALPELAGVYIYGDYETGRIWGLREKNGKAVANGELVDVSQKKLRIASFGQDAVGEVYMVSFDGYIYRLVRRK